MCVFKCFHTYVFFFLQIYVACVHIEYGNVYFLYIFTDINLDSGFCVYVYVIVLGFRVCVCGWCFFVCSTQIAVDVDCVKFGFFWLLKCYYIPKYK